MLWSGNRIRQRVHFNKVGFSNTDGSEGQRIDFEQGVSSEYPGIFYMLREVRKDK